MALTASTPGKPSCGPAAWNLECFDSLASCLETLQARLRDRVEQWHLLRCISLRERERVQAAVDVKWTASVIDTDWLEPASAGRQKNTSVISASCWAGVVQQVSAPELVNQVVTTGRSRRSSMLTQRSPPPANGSSVRVCLTGSSTLRPVTSKPTVESCPNSTGRERGVFARRARAARLCPRAVVGTLEG